jgi:hypothetical protein
MARRYSSVTQRPAVLIFDEDGHLRIIVAGQGLGVFVGMRLPHGAQSDRMEG